MKKIKTAVILTIFVLLTACEPISQNPLGISSANDSGNVLSTEESTDVTENPVSFTEYIAEVPEIKNAETNMIIEAEECDLKGSLYTSDSRKGFSGDGYVTGFYGGSADLLEISLEIETNQHYDITICAASDVQITNHIEVNGKKLQDFSIQGDGNFTRITFYGIYMNEGNNKITVKSGNENFDLDYLEVTNNETIYDTSFELPEEPANPDISAEASELLNYMKDQFGEKIITGQFASNDKNKELELIYKTTGKYPAIRFGDIGGYSSSNTPSVSEINAAADWAEKGGIVGFMWYWNSPSETKSSVYSKETNFSLKAAMTDQDIAKMDISKINELYSKGLITLECLNIIKDIDDVSQSLNTLAQKNIPVLWRPLHEASGEWFWWGSEGAEAYKWLYNLMYDRMTQYHKLNNLIWIWNGQSKDYLVDSDHYDIAAIDIYLDPGTEYSSRSEQYLWLKKITESGKLLAISECSSLPSIDDMVRDNSLWSFFGLWFGDYITDPTGNLSEIYTPKEEFIKMYNAENTVTLESYAGSYGRRNHTTQ